MCNIPLLIYITLIVVIILAHTNVKLIKQNNNFQSNNIRKILTFIKYSYKFFKFFFILR